MARRSLGNASGIGIDAPPHADDAKTALTVGTVLVILVVIAAVAVIVLWARSNQKQVSIVGDSITFYAGTDETAALGTDYHVEAHAGIGKRIDEMLPAVKNAARSDPFAVVVNLGTNDARQASSHPEWRPAFDAMIATLAGQRCVLLTTVNTLMPGEPGVTSVADDINASEVAALASHPNFHIIDWNAALHAPNGLGLLMADRVHPNNAGQLVLSALVRNAVKRDCH
jgi:GDSL-like lipase/acylhydrolase family protein